MRTAISPRLAISIFVIESFCEPDLAMIYYFMPFPTKKSMRVQVHEQFP